MFGIENFPLFVVSGLILNILPGPDSLLITGRTALGGFRAGSAAACGICTGLLVHVLGAALGLSAILATSATAFSIIKIIGGSYLLYMAITMLWDSRKMGGEGALHDMGKFKNTSLSHIFGQGFLTNVFNPKVALFFLAFMPQFIAESSTQKPLAFIVLGLWFTATSLVYTNFLAWVTASIRNRVSVNPRAQKILVRCAASLFGFFGLKLLFATSS